MGNNTVNTINTVGIQPGGTTSRATSSLQQNMNDLHELYTNIQINHPDWDKSRIVSELRKVDYGSDDDGPWDAAMPFNRGNSDLTTVEQEEFQRIRREMIQQDDMDIGHVLVAMDVEQSVNTIPDAAATWSGDLGSAVVTAYQRGTNVQVGGNSRDASMADLIGDIDGVNIANHMESGHEMEALFNYDLGNGQHCDGLTINDRFSTFSADLGLVDDQGNLKDDAADIISDEVTTFFYLDNYINNWKMTKDTVLDILKGDFPDRIDKGVFIPASVIPTLIDQAAEEFIDIIDQGLQQEALAQVSAT